MVPIPSPRRSTRQGLRNAVQRPSQPREPPRSTSPSSHSSISVLPSSSPDPLAPTPTKWTSTAMARPNREPGFSSVLAQDSSGAMEDDQTGMTQANEELRDVESVKRRKISGSRNGTHETTDDARTREGRSTMDRPPSRSVDTRSLRQRTRSQVAQSSSPALTPRFTRSMHEIPPAVSTQLTEKRLMPLTSPKPYKPPLLNVMRTSTAERVKQEAAPTRSHQSMFPITQHIDDLRPTRDEQAEQAAISGSSHSTTRRPSENLIPVIGAARTVSSTGPTVSPQHFEPISDIQELNGRADLSIDATGETEKTRADGLSDEEAQEIAQSEMVLDVGNEIGFIENTSRGLENPANDGQNGLQMWQMDKRVADNVEGKRWIAGTYAQEISNGVLHHSSPLETDLPIAWTKLPPMNGVKSQEAPAIRHSTDFNPLVDRPTTSEPPLLPESLDRHSSSNPGRQRPTHVQSSDCRPPGDARRERDRALKDRRAAGSKVGRESSVPAPMRVRRSGQLSGGQNKMLETMIVECFERAYEALLHAPANLPIMVTTAPFDTSICTRQIPSWWTETPPSMLPAASKPRKDTKYKIPTAGPMITIRSVGGDGTETLPSWRMIKESDDIAESTSKGGRTTRGARGGGRDEDESEPEDMTDEYYEKMHHRYERAEVQARLREQELLQSARYHLKQRLDLLRGMTAQAWSSHVTRIIEANQSLDNGEPDEVPDDQGEAGGPSRSNAAANSSNANYPPTRQRGAVWVEAAQQLLEDIGMEGVRERLIDEGVELLEKYDWFLPQRTREGVAMARAGSHVSEGVEQSRAESWDTRSRKSTPRSEVQQPAPTGKSSSKQMKVAMDAAVIFSLTSSSTPARQPQATGQLPSKLGLGIQPYAEPDPSGQIAAASSMYAYVPITTESGKPILQESADRRLQQMLLAAEQLEKGKPSAEGGRRGRASARSALIQPFGVPISEQVAKKDMFNLDGAGLRPIIEARLKGKAVSTPNQASTVPYNAHSNLISDPSTAVDRVRTSMVSPSKVVPAKVSTTAPSTSTYHAPFLPSQPLQVQSSRLTSTK